MVNFDPVDVFHDRFAPPPKPLRCGEMAQWSLYEYAESALQDVLAYGADKVYVLPILSDMDCAWISRYIALELAKRRND